jgi:hypothetical protein
LGVVSVAHDERKPVEDLAKHVDLRCESPKTVVIGLDLVTVNQAIHHGQVHTSEPATQPQLLDYY